MAGKPWTEEEMNYIRENYEDMTCEEMAVQLPGRTTRSVTHKFNELRLKRYIPQAGDKLNRLTILRVYQVDVGSQMKSYAEVQCECGTIKGKVLLAAMVANKTLSCGCWMSEAVSKRTIERNTTHGLCGHPLYRQYNGMVARCTYTSQAQADDYVNRGIDVCPEWREDFLTYYNWAMQNGWQEGLTIERVDNDKGYNPENCTFATHKQQNNNKRNNRMETAFGETKTVAQWADDYRCIPKYSVLYDRIHVLKWDLERAMLTPVRFIDLPDK